MEDEVNRPARPRFVAEEVPVSEPEPQPVAAPVVEPEVAAPVQPPAPEEKTVPSSWQVSHSTSQFSAGMDTKNLFSQDGMTDKGDKGSNKGLLILTVVLLLAALGVVGFIFLKANKNNTVAPIQPVASASPVPSPVVSPTPSVKFDRATLKVKVLNGSGITGLASKAKTYLEGLGYTNVATGNAASTDFTNTEVAVKDEFQAVSASIVNDLKDKYTVDSKIQTLDANESVDVVITLGQNWWIHH